MAIKIQQIKGGYIMNEQTGIKIYQGLDNLSKGKNDEETLKLIKQKLFDLLNIKNINFLFGSGTSVGAIPTMKGFIE
jgi:hypothetical protein